MVAGIPDQRVRLAETPFFTARERAALALTEAGTRLGEGPVSDGSTPGRPSTFPRPSWPG
jgi:alkylhydroperoxidase family enzyme